MLSKSRRGSPTGYNFDYKNLRNDNLFYKPAFKTATQSGFQDSSTKHEHPCKDPVLKCEQNRQGKKSKKLENSCAVLLKVWQIAKTHTRQTGVLAEP